MSYLIRQALNRSGEIVSIKDADKNSSYYCPLCRCPLVAKQGDINTWSFAHSSNLSGGSPCRNTDLYLSVKNTLLEEKQTKIHLPQVGFPLVNSIQKKIIEDFVKYYEITGTNYSYGLEFYLNFDLVEFEMLRKDRIKTGKQTAVINTPVFAGYTRERKFQIEIYHSRSRLTDTTLFGKDLNVLTLHPAIGFNGKCEYSSWWQKSSFSLLPYHLDNLTP